MAKATKQKLKDNQVEQPIGGVTLIQEVETAVPLAPRGDWSTVQPIIDEITLAAGEMARHRENKVGAQWRAAQRRHQNSVEALKTAWMNQ